MTEVCTSVRLNSFHLFHGACVSKSFLCLLLFAGLTSGVARADDAYSYAYNGAGVSGSGDVTLATTATDGVYQVVTISGQVNGTQIAGLLGTNTYNGNDNLFYAGDSYLDNGGVSFQLVDGSDVNIYYDGSDYYFQGDGNFQLDGGTAPVPAFSNAMFHSFFRVVRDPAIELDSFTFAPLAPASATPEPSSIALFGTGLAAIASLARRKRS